MTNTARIKKNYQRIKWQKLIVVSMLIGFLSAFLGISLKKNNRVLRGDFF